MALMSLSEISPEQKRRLDELERLDREEHGILADPVGKGDRRMMLIPSIVANVPGDKQPSEAIRRIHRMWVDGVGLADIATSIGYCPSYVQRAIHALRAAGVDMSARRPNLAP